MTNDLTFPVETIAQALRITPTRCRQLQREGVLPKPVDKGKWDLIACVHAYLDWKLQGSEQEPKENEKPDYWKEKTRLTKAQAEKEELAIAQRKGELVESAEVVRAWANLVMACRAKLLSLPTKLAYELASESNPNVCLDLLTSAIDEALQELSQIEVEDHE